METASFSRTINPLLGTIQKSVGFVPAWLPSKVSVTRVCSTVTEWPAIDMVERPSASPASPTFSAGLCRAHVAAHFCPGVASGGNRYAVAGQSTVEVVSEPAIDSWVTRRGTLNPFPEPAHSVAVSVCWVRGTQLTVAQLPPVTIIEVVGGNDRSIPGMLRLSPPVVRYE